MQKLYLKINQISIKPNSKNFHYPIIEIYILNYRNFDCGVYITYDLKVFNRGDNLLYYKISRRRHIIDLLIYM